MKSNRIAIGLIINKENKILMGKRNDTEKWTVPAGHLNDGECPFVGMGRELKEETGLDAKEIKMIKAGFEDGLLLYLFEIKIDPSQKIDTSCDPDKECDDWTFEDPFDHIDELHITIKKNWAVRHWANN
jgi:8-oxo-dGTP pyrophosphatase MutT (NUDIX family)